MKTSPSPQPRTEAGSALALTIVMTGIALAILGSALSWSANTTRATHRSMQYTRSIAAAEAAVEKVVTRMNRDYLIGGEKMVGDNAGTYRLAVPTAADSSYWSNWEFNDVANIGRTYVQSGNVTNYVVLDSTYSGLRAFVSTYQVTAHARDTVSLQNVVAGVSQEVQLASIPIFQFAMYSSGDMEISCGQPFRITGRVHANQTLYVEPDSTLTFQSDVTAVSSILFQRHPADKRGSPSGSAVYERPDLKKAPVSAMTLPIGTNNTPLAIREIIQPAPAGEDPNSPMGRARYHNQANMILVVTSTNVVATSGRANGFATILTNVLGTFVATNNVFRDQRESKTVRPIDINVGALAAWSQTNSGFGPISSVYVIDRRILPTNVLGAVRVQNGATLPANGLTVSTARPLYVWGHFNQPNSAHLGTANTTATRPASLVGDALTILSTAWTDANSSSPVASRTAADTTVNAAILTGVVETAWQPDPLSGYSGGMENFPRFLETWGSSRTLTYNGSMVRMFPSQYATSPWGKSDVYSPPRRNWAYDMNFNDANKLPPLTPRLLKVFRGQWATVAPDRNTVASYP